MASAQALPYRCDSDACRETEKSGDIFYLEPNASKTCPNCGTQREGLLTPLAIIHLLVPVAPDKKGEIPELQHDWNFGCETSRKLGRRNRHLTKSLQGCTCQECLHNYEAPKPEALSANLPGGDKHAADRAKVLSKE